MQWLESCSFIGDPVLKLIYFYDLARQNIRGAWENLQNRFLLDWVRLQDVRKNYWYSQSWSITQTGSVNCFHMISMFCHAVGTNTKIVNVDLWLIQREIALYCKQINQSVQICVKKYIFLRTISIKNVYFVNSYTISMAFRIAEQCGHAREHWNSLDFCQLSNMYPIRVAGLFLVTLCPVGLNKYLPTHKKLS